MKHLLLIVLLCCSAQYSFAAPSQAESAKWATNYYKNPEPDSVLLQIQGMDENGMLWTENLSTIETLSGFFSGLFRANPEKITLWLDGTSSPILPLPMSKALRQSGSDIEDAIPDGKREDSEQGHLDNVRETTPASLTLDEFHEADWLWGYFIATGSPSVVERYIKMLDWKGDPNTIELNPDVFKKRTFAILANMTLTQEGKKHPAIVAALKTQRKSSTGRTAELIDGVLQKLSEE